MKLPKIRHTFTIDFEKWIRGSTDLHSNPSKLLRSKDQKLCCLGFFARSCDIPEETILDVPTPAHMIPPRDGIFRELMYGVDYNSPLARKLMTINDNTKISIRVKMEKITDLFRMQGVKVKWENYDKTRKG